MKKSIVTGAVFLCIMVICQNFYAHFFAGAYVSDAGVADDADWFYSQLTFKY